MKDKTRVCIISPEIVGPHTNGGIGTHCYYLSAFLSKQLNQEVTFLYTGKIERRTESYWEKWFSDKLGITFAWLPPSKDPEGTPPGLHSGLAQTAGLVYRWLAARQFDCCHFQEMLGNGFRCFQAKSLGQAFKNTILTCTVHSSWEWVCQAMQSLPQTGMEELQAKFMERYSIQHCDWLISPSDYMFRWLADNQVPMPQNKSVLPYLFDPALKPVGYQPAADHLIFFGRLEVRKGLLLFLEALLALDRAGQFTGRKLRVTFLGRSGYTPDGGGLASIEKFRAEFSDSVQLQPLTDRGHRQAMGYLSENKTALVVCPSLVDNSPYAVIESLQLGLNIIAARSGGIPELFAGEDRLFEPEPAALGKKILAGLKNELPPPAKKYDLKRSSDLWADFCQSTLAEFPSRAETQKPRKSATVRVFVGCGAFDTRLSRTLDSLEAQTVKPQVVTLLCGAGHQGNGGVSQDLNARCQRNGWEIVRLTGNSIRPQSGIAGEGCYDLFLTHGFVPAANLLEKMIAALQSSGLGALTCWCEIRHATGLAREFTFAPLGPCIEGGIFYNLLGAGCLFTKANNVQPEDWQRLLEPGGIWVDLAERTVSEKNWDVLPEALGSLEVDDPKSFGTRLDYASQMKILETCSAAFPTWLRYILVNAVGAERKLRETEDQLETMRAQHKYTPQGVVYKVKRETRRVFKQIQNLGKN